MIPQAIYKTFIVTPSSDAGKQLPARPWLRRKEQGHPKESGRSQYSLNPYFSHASFKSLSRNCGWESRKCQDAQNLPVLRRVYNSCKIDKKSCFEKNTDSGPSDFAGGHG
jgi:hypothetical protein